LYSFYVELLRYIRNILSFCIKYVIFSFVNRCHFIVIEIATAKATLSLREGKADAAISCHLRLPRRFTPRSDYSCYWDCHG